MEAPVENITLSGLEIPIVLRSWGYEELADQASEKLRHDGFRYQVELVVVYPPDSKPRIFGDERLFYTMIQS